MSDQATQLRRLVRERMPASVGPAAASPDPTPAGVVSVGPNGSSSTAGSSADPGAGIALARTIAVCSGKGGVGKTNVAVSLAVALAAAGRRVCLFDADLGLANADVVCGLAPRTTLRDVVLGNRALADAITLAPGGFHLVAGASGVSHLAALDSQQRARLLGQLAALERRFEIMLIDTGAGIGPNVLGLAGAAHRVLVVTTPEPTAVTDAYATIKTLFSHDRRAKIELVVNMAAHGAEGEGVFGRINRACRTFLNQEIGFAGTVPTDTAIPTAVRQQVPFALLAPQSAAARAVSGLAARIDGEGRPAEGDPARLRGYFDRLARWLRGGAKGTAAQHDRQDARSGSRQGRLVL